MHSRQVGRIQNNDFSEVQNLVILQVILLSYLPPHIYISLVVFSLNTFCQFYPSTGN